MKKPLKKDYCKPFILDNSLVIYNSKAHVKDLEKYVEYLEIKIKSLKNKK